MTVLKPFKTFDEQADLLIERGMDIGDRALAIGHLRRVNYYRLSGYWYSFRQFAGPRRADNFFAGTTLADVMALYSFDERLRSATFNALSPVELAVRASLGHALGAIDPEAHLKPHLLNARARTGDMYSVWLDRHTAQVTRSNEPFVVHHRGTYNNTLPVWVAVEVLDWGGLRYLYDMAPRAVQDSVADTFGLTAPQLSSWLNSLEIVRNACAHHGRLFNKVYAKAPKMPPTDTHPGLDAASASMTKTFGQLTMIQYMRDKSGVGRSAILGAVLSSYPQVAPVPASHLGMPADWKATTLWA